MFASVGLHHRPPPPAPGPGRPGAAGRAGPPDGRQPDPAAPGRPGLAPLLPDGGLRRQHGRAAAGRGPAPGPGPGGARPRPPARGARLVGVGDLGALAAAELRPRPGPPGGGRASPPPQWARRRRAGCSTGSTWWWWSRRRRRPRRRPAASSRRGPASAGPCSWSVGEPVRAGPARPTCACRRPGPLARPRPGGRAAAGRRVRWSPTATGAAGRPVERELWLPTAAGRRGGGVRSGARWTRGTPAAGRLPGASSRPGWRGRTTAAQLLRQFCRVVDALREVCPWVDAVRPGVCALPVRGPARYFGGEAAVLATGGRGGRRHPGRRRRCAGRDARHRRRAPGGGRRGLRRRPGGPGRGGGGRRGAPRGSWPPGPSPCSGTPELAERAGAPGAPHPGGASPRLATADVLARFGAEGAHCHRLARGEHGELPGYRTPGLAAALGALRPRGRPAQLPGRVLGRGQHSRRAGGRGADRPPAPVRPRGGGGAGAAGRPGAGRPGRLRHLAGRPGRGARRAVTRRAVACRAVACRAGDGRAGDGRALARAAPAAGPVPGVRPARAGRGGRRRRGRRAGRAAAGCSPPAPTASRWPAAPGWPSPGGARRGRSRSGGGWPAGGARPASR